MITAVIVLSFVVLILLLSLYAAYYTIWTQSEDIKEKNNVILNLTKEYEDAVRKQY